MKASRLVVGKKDLGAFDDDRRRDLLNAASIEIRTVDDVAQVLIDVAGQ